MAMGVRAKLTVLLIFWGLWIGTGETSAQGTRPTPIPNPEPEPLPAVPPGIPPVVLPSVPGGDAGSVPDASGKLDSALRLALDRVIAPGANTLKILRELNLDTNARLEVLVEVEVLGNIDGIQRRIAALGGKVVKSRFGGADLRARLPLRQIPRLAEERGVVSIRAVSLLLGDLRPGQPEEDVGIGLPTAPTVGVIVREFPERALNSIRDAVVEKRNRSGAQKKLDTGLVIAAQRSRNAELANGALKRVQPTLTRDMTDRVLVNIRLRRGDAGFVNQLRNAGGGITSRVDRFRSLQAWVPVAQLERLAGHSAVHSIRRAIPPITRKQSHSEGDIRHRVDVIRGQFGFDGQGVKIGVISNGVDTLVARQQSGELPGGISVLPGQHGSGDEGTAILEVVNDLAPGAELFFATGFPSEARMAQNILDLAAAGCDVLVDDVGHLLAPVFQDGLAAQAVETVFQQGVAYFSAAGNAGNFDGGTSGVWEGDFMASELTIEGQTYTVHDFGGGLLFNELRTDPRSMITLQWSDPFGAAANDYDLYLLDENGAEIIAVSNNVQDGTGDPLEFIDSRLEDHLWYRLVIVKAQGENRYLRLDTFGAELERVTAGQVFGHPAAKNAIAVGAVYQGYGSLGPGYFDGDEIVEPFSSDGPRRMFFDAEGRPLTPDDFSASGGMVREKPDFVAADGVATNTPLYEQFFGTSAAAPHAAAIGALMIQRGITDPLQIRRLFEVTSLDVETPGFDRKSGHGIVDAFGAMHSPLAIDDHMVLPYSPALIVSEPALIENDQPGILSGDLSVMAVGPVTERGGTVSLENGLIVYRPPLGFRGVDRFSYTLSEVGSSSFTASVSVQVDDRPPSPPSFRITRDESGTFLLLVEGMPSQFVAVDRADRVWPPIEWSEHGTVLLDSLGKGQLSISGDSDQRYFRLRGL